MKRHKRSSWYVLKSIAAALALGGCVHLSSGAGSENLAVARTDLPSIAAMTSAADVFLGSLDEAKHSKAVFPFDTGERENFKFTPQTRTGLPLKEMDDVQRRAAMRLLEAVLSEKGRLKAIQIIALEGVLRDLGNRPEVRDPGKYYISVFGKPGDARGWGWKFEGHHLALNYTVVEGRQVAVTPTFFAASPAEVRQGAHKGLRVLAAEEDLAMTLANMLFQGGERGVVFSDKPPADILTAEKRQVVALDPVGIMASEMTEAQRGALLALVKEYTTRHRSDLADADMQKIERAGIDRIRFGWAGGMKRGDAWYYRVQGPTFLMEAANTQNNANHIHATWRDFEGDFGRDLLGEHYRRHE